MRVSRILLIRTAIVLGAALTVGCGLDQHPIAAETWPAWGRFAMASAMTLGFLYLGAAAVACFHAETFWSRGRHVTLCEIMVLLGLATFVFAAAGWLIASHCAPGPLFLSASAAIGTTGLFLRFVARPATTHLTDSQPFRKELTHLLAPIDGPKVVGAGGRTVALMHHMCDEGHVLEIDSDVAALGQAESIPSILVIESNELEDYEQGLASLGYTFLMQRVLGKTQLSIYAREAMKTSLAFVGDFGIGGKPTGRLMRVLAREADRDALSALFMLGDNVLGKRPFSIAVRDRFYQPMRPILERGVPIHAIVGNHDRQKNRLRHTLQFPPFHMNEQRCWKRSFGRPEVAVFAIDSDQLIKEPARREQLDWLRDELARSTGHWNVLLLHHPVVSSRIHHKSKKRLYNVLMPILTAEPRIDVALSGHNHFYERREPHQGIQFLTCGGGGEIVQQAGLPPGRPTHCRLQGS